MTDFLDEKRDEIEGRLAELRPLVEEYARLLAAAAALRGVDGSSGAGMLEDVVGQVLVSGVPSDSSRVESERASVDGEPLSDPLDDPGSAPVPAAPRHAAPRHVGPGPAAVRPAAPGLATTGAAAPSPAAPGASEGPRRAGRPKGSGTRAAEALRIVREHPGVTIPELADRMGIKQNYLYRVLPDLVQEGKVAKQGRGWHPKA